MASAKRIVRVVIEAGGGYRYAAVTRGCYHAGVLLDRSLLFPHKFAGNGLAL
jgi:hypothetical protein